jgi:hypothetical protein
MKKIRRIEAVVMPTMIEMTMKTLPRVVMTTISPYPTVTWVTTW